MPWSSWFIHAVCVLKLSPSEFWVMSAVEWQWLLEGANDAPQERLQFADLDALRTLYPDHHNGK